jgi:hypothetical protein
VLLANTEGLQENNSPPSKMGSPPVSAAKSLGTPTHLGEAGHLHKDYSPLCKGKHIRFSLTCMSCCVPDFLPGEPLTGNTCCVDCQAAAAPVSPVGADLSGGVYDVMAMSPCDLDPTPLKALLVRISRHRHLHLRFRGFEVLDMPG